MDAGGRMKVVKNTRSATNISFMPLLVIVKVISFPLIILPTVCTFWSFWSTPEKQSQSMLSLSCFKSGERSGPLSGASG